MRGDSFVLELEKSFKASFNHWSAVAQRQISERASCGGVGISACRVTLDQEILKRLWGKSADPSWFVLIAACVLLII